MRGTSRAQNRNQSKRCDWGARVGGVTGGGGARGWRCDWGARVGGVTGGGRELEV